MPDPIPPPVDPTDRLPSVLALLRVHRIAFFDAVPFAEATAHPVPCDTRAWSQILVSHLTGINGIARKKGADLADGSDVKAANTWLAIDTPRFNGVIKSGRKGERGSIAALGATPRLFFVLWDTTPEPRTERCRTWVVRTAEDLVFRGMCERWYQQRDEGAIKSDNFQLHPPRGLDSDVFRNKCGNLTYPLLFRADWNAANTEFEVKAFRPEVLRDGTCAAIA